MKKVICFVMIIMVILCMLSACGQISMTDVLSMGEAEEQKDVNDISTQIANYIDQENNDKLLALFSKNAIYAQVDMKEELRLIIKELKGGEFENDTVSKSNGNEIVHNLKVNSPSVEDSIEYGSVERKIYGFYFIVNSNEKRYRVDITYVKICKDSPEEVGIKMLYVSDDTIDSDENIPEYGAYH